MSLLHKPFLFLYYRSILSAAQPVSDELEIARERLISVLPGCNTAD